MKFRHWMICFAGMIMSSSLGYAQDLDEVGWSPDEDAVINAAADNGSLVRAHRLKNRPVFRNLMPGETGALSGKRIGLSPGHGIKRDADQNRWAWQSSVMSVPFG